MKKKTTKKMMSKILKTSDKEFIIGQFDKRFANDKYELLFNTQTGFEALRGINGHPDPFQLEFPSMLDVGIMGHCKNNCEICYQGHAYEDNMTLDNFKKIIDQAKYHTNQVALGGRGDPNLHENFKEILEYCRENNVVPNYTTSGNSLTDEQIKISKICGAVAVSDYRKDYSYSALQRLTDAKIKTNLHFVLTKHTYEDALKIIYGHNPWRTNGNQDSLFDINKLNAVVFLLFKPQGKALDLIDFNPTPNQLKTFSELVIKPSCKVKVGMDSCLVNHVLQYVEMSDMQKMSVDSCESSRMSVYISPSMHLIPCSFADHEKCGVSLKKKSIFKVWNNAPEFKRFRKILKKNPYTCPAGF
jgi:MoaA/NifB/PqqE/SkfB family radical SAM enzyme